MSLLEFGTWELSYLLYPARPAAYQEIEKEQVMEPKDHILWDQFVKFANANGIDLTYRDDWQAWWDCFEAGVRAEYTRMLEFT